MLGDITEMTRLLVWPVCNSLFSSSLGTRAKDYNSCTLHKLIYPDTKGGKWYLSEVKRFQDEE